MKNYSVIVLALSAVALSASASAQELVANGDFTQGIGTLVGWNYYGNGQIAGWTGLSGGMEIGNQSVYGTSGFTGNIAELHSNDQDAYTQAITVSSAGTYNLSFLSARRAGVADPYNDVISSFNGQQFTDTAASTSASLFSHSFTVSSAGVYDLTFSTHGGGSYGGIIGDISMSKAAATPEPAPMAALGIGLIGIVARRRRK